jgi:hypothetical protein
MSLNEDTAKPMIGQVGGLSKHKKPLQTLAPDYILKPLLPDHRGIREMAFYELIQLLAKNPGINVYTAFLAAGKPVGFSTTGTELDETKNASGADHLLWKLRALWKQSEEAVDTVAMALAVLVHDRVVVESEEALETVCINVKREIESIRHLAKFTPPYYGVVGQHELCFSEKSPLGLSEDAHLLLQDLTNHYSKPCVMDLKMGTCTFEPDAPMEKQNREREKYAQQKKFGFRIIGMRMYDPTDPLSDDKGYRYFDKSFGRSLETREQVLEAFSIFFGAGVEKPLPPLSVIRMEHDVQNEQPLFSLVPRYDDNQSSTNSHVIVDSDTRTDVSVSSLLSTIPTQAQRRIRTRAIANILAHLRPLRRWFDENKSLRFVASSVLLVYEGDTTLDSSSRDATTVKMIDFGRVRRAEEDGVHHATDKGYVHGLRTLKGILTEMVNSEEEAQQQSSIHGTTLYSTVGSTSERNIDR